MPYWLVLFVLRETCRQNRLYETVFHNVTIPSKHHHHYVPVRGDSGTGGDHDDVSGGILLGHEHHLT
jgi:hypothetical protein